MCVLGAVMPTTRRGVGGEPTEFKRPRLNLHHSRADKKRHVGAFLFLVVCFVHMSDKVEHLATITPLVIVPSDEFDKTW